MPPSVPKRYDLGYASLRKSKIGLENGFCVPISPAKRSQHAKATYHNTDIAHSLQTGSLYGLFTDLLPNSSGAWERQESLQCSLYDLSTYIQILNIHCWLANSTWHMSNKWNSKGRTCSKTVLGCRQVTEDCFFAQNWGKIFQRWKSGHL